MLFKCISIKGHNFSFVQAIDHKPFTSVGVFAFVIKGFLQPMASHRFSHISHDDSC